MGFTGDIFWDLMLFFGNYNQQSDILMEYLC